MNSGPEAVVSSTYVDKAENSAPGDDGLSTKHTRPRRPLQQNKAKGTRSLACSKSERKSRRAKPKIDHRATRAESGDSLELEADAFDTRLPLRPSSQPSPSATSETDSSGTESSETLQLARYGAGPRNDPFSAYPIPADGCVPHAVDVFLQVWAPRQIPPHLRSTVGNPMASQLFPLALQNAGLFEAIVALSQTYEAIHHTTEVRPTKEVLQHQGNALIKVRDQLSSPSEPLDEVTMLTILFLMGVHFLVGDKESYGVHLKGIHRMVDLRGGLDKLGLRGITKAMVLQIDNYWTLMTGTMSKYSSTEPVERLEYPRHPFFPDLCASIAAMPKGFRDLALEGVLSTQMLHILERVSKFVAHVERAHQRVATMQDIYFLLLYKPHLVVQDAYVCLKSWRTGGGSNIEPALCFGLIAFSWSVMGQGRIGPTYWELIQNLANSIEQVEPSEHETDGLTWLSMIAAAHCRGNKSLSLQADRILDRLMERDARTKDWDNLQAILRKFFWYGPLAVEWEYFWKAAVRRAASEDWELQSPATSNSNSFGRSPQSDTSRTTPLF